MRLFILALTLSLVASPLAAQSQPITGVAAGSVTPATDLSPGAFLVRPEGVERPPVIIALGGSEGGDSAARGDASRFAAQGYAVLGLPYYSPAYGDQPQEVEGLPKAFVDIPLDLVERARDWLRARTDVDGERIGLYGVSKGAEFALAAAARVDGLAAVVAIVPSDVVWEGWGDGQPEGTSASFSWRGKALPFVPYVGMNAEFAKFGTGETPRLRTPQDAGRRAHPDAAATARIRVEDIDEPVLVAGGEKDDIWASGEMARAIAERRAAAGLQTVIYDFPEAGHFLGGTGEGSVNDAGGEANLAAQKMVWPATLAFLDRHLKR